MSEQLALTTVNHEELEALMDVILARQKTIFIRGGVGIGKSMSTHNYAVRTAAKMGRKFTVWVDLTKEEKETLAHSQGALEAAYIYAPFDTLTKTPEDLSGLPMPINGYMDWIPPRLFAVLSKKGAAGILFLDEILQAPQAVQKPTAELYLNKIISDLRLAKDVCVVGASNEREDKCGTTELLPHQQARVSMYSLSTPDFQAWIKWAQSKDTVDSEGNLQAFIDPRVIMFIMNFPDQLYQSMAARSAKYFPSPRGWHDVSDLIRDIDETKNKRLFLQLVAGRVGNGPAAKFKAVLDHNMEEHGPKILANARTFKDAPWDRRVAFSMWAAAHSKARKEFMHRTCQFLDDLGTDEMLDTILYMMKSIVGSPFLTACTGSRYPKLREALKAMHTMIEGDS